MAAVVGLLRGPVPQWQGLESSALAGSNGERQSEPVALAGSCWSAEDELNSRVQPPPVLDGAQVLFWAWSDFPFFVMPNGGDGIPIHGVAVAQYSSGEVYRFHCDVGWCVRGDWDCDSVEDAMGRGLTTFQTGAVLWRPFDA